MRTIYFLFVHLLVLISIKLEPELILLSYLKIGYTCIELDSLIYIFETEISWYYKIVPNF